VVCRPVILSSLVINLVIGWGCGRGNPGPQQMPDNVEAPPAPALKGDPGHTTPAGKNVAPDITLPRGTGSPPVKTTAAIPTATLKQLGALEFAGFSRSIVTDDGTALSVYHTTKSRPKLRVTVTIEPCSAKTECTKMDLEAWRAKGDVLKGYLTPTLIARPDTQFDVEGVTLNGATMIGTYQAALDAQTDENNNPKGEQSNAYIVYYNDGANRITVVAEYRDGIPKSIGQLQGYAPRDQLKMMATRFLDFFTQNWATADAGSAKPGSGSNTIF
jgi:hypothetical protein